MFCPSCGAENTATANFCAECGTVLPSSKGHVAATIAPPTPSPQNRASQLGGSSAAGAGGAAQVVDPAISIQHALTSGTLFAGRYEIHGVLGKGGMGIVYRAKDTELGETIAIKVLQAQLTADPADVERFKREIITARRITHPNVIRIHDFGVSGDEAFISMELLEGGTLAGMIQRGELDLSGAVRISLELAAGLAAAHDEGVIHRDIKPHNVLFDKNDKAKLLDFGIARLSAATSHTVGFTGTPHYMSPEQAEGRQVSFKSDLYALGVLMFEMFSGELPFQADSLVRLAVMHAQEPPPPLKSKNPDIPDELEAIVMRALEKNPDYRYQDARQIVDDLKAYQQERDLVHAVVGAPQRSPGVPGSASVAGEAESLRPGTIPPKPGTIPPKSLQAPPSEKKKGGLKWLVAAGLFLLVGGGAFFAYNQFFKDRDRSDRGTGTILAMKPDKSGGETAVTSEAGDPATRTAGAGFDAGDGSVAADQRGQRGGRSSGVGSRRGQGTRGGTGTGAGRGSRGEKDTAGQKQGPQGTPVDLAAAHPVTPGDEVEEGNDPAVESQPVATTTPKDRKTGWRDKLKQHVDSATNNEIVVSQGTDQAVANATPTQGSSVATPTRGAAGSAPTTFKITVLHAKTGKPITNAQVRFCGREFGTDSAGQVKQRWVIEEDFLNFGCEIQVKINGKKVDAERIFPSYGDRVVKKYKVVPPL